MKGKQLSIILMVLACLIIILGGVNAGLANQSARSLLQENVPAMISYQGQVKVGGVPYNGTGYFKFAIIDGGENIIWSNDGLEVSPTNSISLTVSNGLFNVLLGDTTIMAALPASVFTFSDCYLRIWFSSNGSSFTLLSPDQRIAAVPFAMNAELLDGSDLGNSSGQVPVNNGSLNISLNADRLDGYDANKFQQHYDNYVVVAKSGGDYATISAALSSILDADSTNRYLIKVMPGEYDEQVTMKEYVDVEGSGENTTKITHHGGSGSNQLSSTVIGASHAELRWLTVENTGGNNYAFAINNYTASPQLTHLTVNVSGGSTGNYGISNSSSSSIKMTNLEVSCSGVGSCFGVSNSSTSAQEMRNVNINASSEDIAYGIHQSASSSLLMTNVSINTSAVTYSYGVWNQSSFMKMMDMSVNASGSSTANSGVVNWDASASIFNSVIAATGPAGNYGIDNISTQSGPYTVTVNSSQIVGSLHTIDNASVYTTTVGASLLSGGNVTGGGTLICAGVYDKNYTFYASSCP